MSSAKSKNSDSRIKIDNSKLRKIPSPNSLASSPLIALASGILMGFSVAPVGAWFLAWIALAPLWVLVVRSQESGVRSQKEKTLHPSSFILHPSSFLHPLAWGIGYHGVALFWITGIHPMTWMGVPWINSLAIALFCWIFITLWGAALVIAWAVGMRAILAWGGLDVTKSQNPKISHSSPLNASFLNGGNRGTELAPPRPSKLFTRVLIGVALWCGLESLWSSGSLWWSSLSYTQSPHNLAILHLGQLSGANTVTAAIVSVNALFAEAWIKFQESGVRSQELGVRSQELGVGSRESGVRSRESGVRSQESGVGSRESGVRSQELGVGSRESRVRLKHSGFWLLASDNWLLASGFWLLASGFSLLIGLHLLGYNLYTRPLTQPPDTALKVGIIQGNVPNQIKLYPEGIQKAIAGYTQGYKTLADAGVDAVLTPEGALPFRWKYVIGTPFYSAVKEKGVVAWVGAFGEEGRSYTNSLFTLTGTGEVYSRYNKVKLVPIGEYIPFEQYLGDIVGRLSPLDEHQVAGAPNQVFDTPFGRAIVVICYGSAFPEQFRYQAAAGGQFILSPSNDAHYSAAMPAQHHALDVMRAIETDRWGVRATNTGYSAIVDPHGRSVWRSGHNTYELHADTIYRRQSKTLYVRWGDWLTWLLLVLGAIALVYHRMRSHQY